MPYRNTSSRRVPYSTWVKMTPAQKAAKSRAVNRSKRFSRSRTSNPDSNYSLIRKAPTIGGPSVGTSLLTKTPLFPVRKYVKQQLYYDSNIILTSSIGSLALYNFSANGIYDPNITGTGHQPIGFDQMMSMYEQYTVIRSRIKVTFVSGAEPGRVAISLSPDATSPTNISTAMENGLLTTTTVTGTDSGQHRVKSLTLTCDVPKYFGKPFNSVLADSTMTGTIASNPPEQVYFQILAWDPYQASDFSVALDVTLSYDVMYWEPKKLVSS